MFFWEKKHTKVTTRTSLLNTWADGSQSQWPTLVTRVCVYMYTDISMPPDNVSIHRYSGIALCHSMEDLSFPLKHNHFFCSLPQTLENAALLSFQSRYKTERLAPSAQTEGDGCRPLCPDAAGRRVHLGSSLILPVCLLSLRSPQGLFPSSPRCFLSTSADVSESLLECVRELHLPDFPKENVSLRVW